MERIFLEPEELAEINTNRIKISEEDVEGINADNLFLAIVEPKLGSRTGMSLVTSVFEDVLVNMIDDLSETRIIDYFDIAKSKQKSEPQVETEEIHETKIIDFENAKNRLKQVKEQIQEPTFHEKLVDSIQSQTSRENVDLDCENRSVSIMYAPAFLTLIDGKIFDFVDGNYLDLDEYYLNYAVPFSQVFEDNEWHFVYAENVDAVLIKINEDKFNQFMDGNNRVIDKDAYSKVMGIHQKTIKKEKTNQ